MYPELEVYLDARTVVDLSRAELNRNFPQLAKTLSFSEDQSDLPALLEKIGANVEAFFQYFPNTASVEEVRQDVRRSDGRLLNSAGGSYNYLMIISVAQEVGLNEYRTDRRGNESNPRGPAGGFMLTSKLVWHLVHFHPLYQADSQFRYLGQTSKPPAHVIAFAQNPRAAREVAEISIRDPKLSGRRIYILLQGLVWVDPTTFQIIRAHTDLLAPRYDVGLASDTTEIECAAIRFNAVGRSFWLPKEVVVTAVFRNYTYTNRHRYSDYRLFSVETQDKVHPPIPPKPPE